VSIGAHYLGDGLYASFDGEFIWLRAPREHGDHYVALDVHSVLPSFLDYVERLKAELGAPARP